MDKLVSRRPFSAWHLDWIDIDHRIRSVVQKTARSVLLIIDGNEVAAKVCNDVAETIKQYNMSPTLGIILIGENDASRVYIGNKVKRCAQVGINTVVHTYKETTPQSVIEDHIFKWNVDDNIDGILIQLPVPIGFDQNRLLSKIMLEKDVDGFHPINAGKLMQNSKPLFVPCTAAGIMKLIESTGTKLSGKRAVVIGRSISVGKPVASLLLNEDCTVTICNSLTTGLDQIASEADILVAAIGKPNYITEKHVRSGAIVIDVGINRLNEQLVGDVDFKKVFDIAKYITPVPGGVGPMTVAMLMSNVVKAAGRQVREQRGQ